MVTKKPKGELTRLAILDQARILFNKRGIFITLDNLASAMGIPKGRITNHFSTKDKLFLAILAQYETARADMLLKNSKIYASSTLADYVAIIEKIMDIQYEYRSAIMYIMVLAQGQDELKEHVSDNFKRNKELIRSRLERLVDAKLIVPGILETMAFESFIFMYVNNVTQWIIYYGLYENGDVNKAKSLYIRSILEHIYGHYLTVKGKKQLSIIARERKWPGF